MRLSKIDLQKIMKEYNVSRLWSWSKWNSFKNSMYEYYLKYILKVKEDRANSIYTTTGGLAHNILESFYEGKITAEQMVDDFEDGWVTAFEIADLKFDRNDESHNDKIAERYHDNLRHFFMNHKPVKYKIMIEQFVKAMIGNNLFQGYIDACFKDDDGNINIVDFKTSSIYKGKKAEDEAGQLIVYAIGLNQQGIPFDKIRICWNFLKYVSVQYEQANGAVKTREIERCEIGEKLQSNAKVWLKKFGYADQMDDYLKQMLDTNGIECLPKEVQDKYVISDCYVYVSITQALIDRWENDIITTITDIELREKDYFEMKSKGLDEEVCSKAFWDDDEAVVKKSYYFATLCSYSPSLHLPYKAYLDRLEQQKNGQDTFAGLGGNSGEVTASVDIPTNKKGHQSKEPEVDLSWLDNL